jgi:hypothetical protein
VCLLVFFRLSISVGLSVCVCELGRARALSMALRCFFSLSRRCLMFSCSLMFSRSYAANSALAFLTAAPSV